MDNAIANRLVNNVLPRLIIAIEDLTKAIKYSNKLREKEIGNSGVLDIRDIAKEYQSGGEVQNGNNE